MFAEKVGARDERDDRLISRFPKSCPIPDIPYIAHFFSSSNANIRMWPGSPGFFSEIV